MPFSDKECCIEEARYNCFEIYIFPKAELVHKEQGHVLPLKLLVFKENMSLLYSCRYPSVATQILC